MVHTTFFLGATSVLEEEMQSLEKGEHDTLGQKTWLPSGSLKGDSCPYISWGKGGRLGNETTPSQSPLILNSGQFPISEL